MSASDRPGLPAPSRAADLIVRQLDDDGTFPNNARLPLVLYRAAFAFEEDEEAAAVLEERFTANGWHGTWRDGIYPFRHYHSTAHEVLGVARGTARLEFGGPSGVVLELQAGDVAILPAGVAHRNEASSADFLVVGAYPGTQQVDMNYGRPGERPGADHNIAAVPPPALDPVYGAGGPLAKHWRLPA